ncbi:MAG: TrmH family RNA methyltransferase [Bacteroidetes bacterium]|nr:MAG: TrmH family RNA methyltransferase [Bacteroidota bacterium]
MRKLRNDELGRVNVEEFKKLEKLPITIVLDNIRSLMNIGSVFRTSDAFTIKEILLCGITAKPPHREMQKTALGATESVSWRYFDNTVDAIKELKANGITVLSIEQADEAKMLDTYEFDFSNEIALVFGNEVKGVSDEVIVLSDDCIEIPQFGTKHSLNISISAGVLIWECFQQYQSNLE